MNFYPLNKDGKQEKPMSNQEESEYAYKHPEYPKTLEMENR